MRYYEPSEKKLLKCGVLTVDEDDLITDMTEKSPTPATHWCCPPFCYYTKEDAKRVNCRRLWNRCAGKLYRVALQKITGSCNGNAGKQI